MEKMGCTVIVIALLFVLFFYGVHCTNQQILREVATLRICGLTLFLSWALTSTTKEVACHDEGIDFKKKQSSVSFNYLPLLHA
jgi:hypothetical protein